ncbi:MAG TPA: dihydrolipoamide acetyltransferase family protein [Thermoanaerobaculia bacterium]|jgi:pyruvate dehydrogenase E2 component (dihydrolipoamide acetyltransferase)|nr:dihydrolipoamide acetyltransferase family protein [Thermoanaerobaculia bacterium]
MAELIMPKAGDAMTEGKVVKWYKQPGDAVKRGEPLAEIETDKVNLDLEAEADGVLGAHAAKEGDMVPVGNVLARILAEGEKEEPKAEAPAETKEEPQRRATDKKESVKHTTGEYHEAIEQRGPRRDRSAPEEAAPADKPSESGRQRSSPLARRMARDLGVDLEGVQGSGPRGRVVAADVKNAKPATASGPTGSQPATAKPITPLAPAPSLETKIIPLSAMRRTIAKRLAESTGPIPHFYLTADYDVTNLMSVRTQMVEITGVKVSLNDFIIRAIALALRHHPAVNASWGDDAITQHGEVHVGVAVATTDGLITPVIRNADQKSVADIATEVRLLADKAKNRRLKPDEYQGSTFTISNLGAWGIEEFTAIINPPNAAILAIGAAEPRAVVDANRQVVVRDRMKVTLSCDHRIVDGALGADFLKTLRSYVEQPLRLVV